MTDHTIPPNDDEFMEHERAIGNTVLLGYARKRSAVAAKIRAEYRYCGASIDVTGEKGSVCSRRIGHDGKCAPRHDEDNDQAARAAIAPLKAAIRKAKAQERAEIRAQALRDGGDRIAELLRDTPEYGPWVKAQLYRMADGELADAKSTEQPQ
ncbi:hypothetical protein ACGFZC_07420 [[Kitasatospora] papulosa]|uniref:hypothetical protein n=1 Tax=Streptomyces TaxID=1883 RepID=UPI000561CFDB|nr:hypothetical protein [Streptomyces sp. NRRL S-325]